MKRLDRRFLLSALGMVAGVLALELTFTLLLTSILPPLGRIGEALLHAGLLALLLTPLGLWILRSQRRGPSDPRRTDALGDEEATLLWAAVEQLPVSVIVTDPQGRIRYVNPAFTRVTGYSPEEAIGETPRLLKSGKQDPAFYAGLWAAITAGNAWRGEVINLRRDGTPYVQELVIQPVRDSAGCVAHFVGIGHDVTERRLAQEAFEKAKLSMDQGTDMILWVDPDGRFTYANASAARGSGYSRNELLRLSVWELTESFSREAWQETYEGVRRAGSLRMETGIRRKDRSRLPGEVVVTHLDLGGQEFQCAVFRDLTEQKQAEAALRESTDALLESQRVAQLGSYRADLVHGTWTGTPVLDEILGLPALPKDVSAWLSIVHPEDQEGIAAYLAHDVIEKGQRFDREYRVVRPSDGETRWVHGIGELVRDQEGRPTDLIGTIQDITSRKAADRALSESEAQFRALSDQSLTGIALIQDGRFVYVNPRLAEMFGYQPGEMLGLMTVDVVHEDDRPMMRESIRQRLSGEVQSVHHLFKGLRKDGSTVELELFGRSLTYLGRPAAMSTLLDITERKKAEMQLQAQERRFRSLIEHSAEGIGLMAGDTTAIYLSPAFTRMLGYPTKEWLGRRLLDLIHPEDYPQAVATLASGLETPEVPVSWQFRFRDAEGEWRWMEGTAVNRVDDPAVEGIVVNWREITDRKQAEEALRESEARLRALLRGVPDLIFVLDGSGIFLDHHSASGSQSSLPPERFLGRHVRDVLTPEYARRFEQAFADARRSGATQHVEYTVVAGEATRHYEARVVPMEGNTLTVVTRDMTSEKTLEAQLRQAQKMEAVGQLTGGIAHDFNNILMAIVGYTDFLLKEITASPAMAEDVLEIRKAADRATVLTRQLLAFSRRQVLVPQLLDLNALVRETGKMLQRLIGADVALRTHLADSLGTVRADPGQLEQVIMNLVLNARDAMPNGGTLSIGTSDVDLDQSYVESHPYVTAGPHVLLWVSDSGVGMSREVMSHVFEPFFTTKQQGKGTGLGLATVYGIVKQSGGHISVYSEPGEGSTFKIYLPRVDEAPQGIAAPVKQPPAGGRETILVADDDDAVRALMRRVLAEHGYTVLVAANPAAAREAVRTPSSSIDLLITDVVMPGQSGRELADELTAMVPALKVLYMSGYTHDAIVHRGVLDPGIHFISKPVSSEVLLRTVRSVLDGPADG
jgi:PAS domain S-box-containing protein